MKLSIIETTKTITEVTYVCDICGKQSTSMHTCSLCKRHACEDHIERSDYDYIDGSSHGDYPDWVCSKCCVILYSPKIRIMIYNYKKKQRELDDLYITIDKRIQELIKEEPYG